MSLRGIWAVFRKEFRENLRDKRTLLSALVFGPVISPILVAGLVQFSISHAETQSDENIVVAVTHSENAPNLIDYLSARGVDIVKVDLSLVQGGILHDPSHGILRALQELAARWNATIIAEGVETGEQLAVIRELGITAGQGYLLGRPARERRVASLNLESLMPTEPIEEVGEPAA